MQINATAIGPTDGRAAKWMSEVCRLESKRRAFNDLPIGEDC